MKTFFLGCGGIVLGLVAGIVLSFIAAQSSQFRNPSTLTPTASSARPDLSITASAPFVTSQLQQALRQSGSVKNATVTLAAPNLVRIAMTVELNVFGQPVAVNGTVAMRVSAQKGRIVVTTDSVDTGGIAVPQALVDSTIERVRAPAEDGLNRVVQRALQGTNLRVANIRMTADDLTVELSSQ